MSIRARIHRFRLPAPLLVAALLAALGGPAGAEDKQKGVPDVDPLAPVLAPAGGIFTNPVTVRVSAPAGAVVRFTLDGSEPVAASPAWAGALTVSNAALVRVRSFPAGRPPGDPVTQNYLVLAPDLTGFSSTLPLVVLSASGQSYTNRKTLVAARFLESTQAGRITLTAPADFSGRAWLNVRGHSSRRYPKTSFTFRPADEAGDKLKAGPLGFPPADEWVLYAPYPDKTLIRDMLGYEVQRRLGWWSPRTRHVELFLHDDGEALSMRHYHGVYVFEDRVTREDHRLDLKRLGPEDNDEPDISGGWLLKKDHVGRGRRPRADNGREVELGRLPPVTLPSGPDGFPGDPAGFVEDEDSESRGKRSRNRVGNNDPPDRGLLPARPVTNRIGFVTGAVDDRPLGWEEVPADREGFDLPFSGGFLFYIEPEPDEVTGRQRAWIRDWFGRFEAALYGPAFRDPVQGYPAWLNIESFIDHHLLVEWCKNVDGFRFSTFLHKDRGGKLVMGPAWDLNLTFGMTKSFGCDDPEGWLWRHFNDQDYSWYRRLFADPDFAQRYVDRWAEVRRSALATEDVLALIDRWTAGLAEAQVRNFQRWEILGVELRPNAFVGSTYAEEVDRVRSWTTNRLAWMDRQFVASPELRHTNGTVSVTGVPAGGDIALAIDGRDPRVPGGMPASGVRLLTNAISLTLPPGASVVARARAAGGTRWSAPARLSLSRP